MSDATDVKCPVINESCYYFSYQLDQNGELAIAHCLNSKNKHPYNNNCTKEACPIYNFHLDLTSKLEFRSKHYSYSYKGVKLDPYRIFDIYNIKNAAQQHAIKKLLRAGNSVKPLSQDIAEVIESLQRWLEMIEEDR